MPDPSTMLRLNLSDSPLERAFQHAADFLDTLDERPVGARATADELRRGFVRPLPEQGCDPSEVIDDLVSAADRGLHGSSGPRFFGWVIGGALPSALAADWLAAAWDQNAGAFGVSPSSAVVEEAAGAWLKDVLGLPAHASFAFVTGCQMAHVACLMTARHALLERLGWDVERDGLFGAPRIRLLTSDQHHASLDRAVRFVGLGSASIVDLPTGDDCRLPAAALERALAEADGPAIVALQAGDLSTGAFDDFETLIPIAHAAGAWVHVDGAFGLWAAASPAYRHLVRGLDEADSWATDGHKWLNVPYDSGLAFTAHPDAHQASMTQRASYMPETAARDQLDWNPEFSRRARGFAIYAALRELGRSGLADLIERTCAHCRALTRDIGGLDGAELLAAPIINQGLVRFLDPRPGATEADHDRRTDQVIDAIVASGEAFFGGVTWRGRRAMRISVCNWRTSVTDVERVVEAVRQALVSLG
jgi:glutamate/tyrosine decarboxylase-like PLP-dependent enzyme